MSEKENTNTYVNSSLSINKNIYKKIQMLVKTSTTPDLDSNSNSPQKSIVQQKADKFELESLEKPLIWKVVDNLYIVCEALNCRTELSTKRNNIDSLVEHLTATYQDSYLVISHKRSGISRHFKKCIAYDDAAFNLQHSIDIARLSKFWISHNKNNVLIVEMRNGRENIIVFIIVCIISYINPQWTAESILNTLPSIILDQFLARNFESTLRYTKYYDQMILFNSTAVFPSKILNQVIITTIPTILGDGIFIPKMKLTTHSNTIEFPAEKCYLDNNYIIFSSLNAEIATDSVISLWFSQENKSYHILDLSINTLFYSQGLYRFTRSEIETSLPQENIYRFFDENFYIDIVLIENRENMIKNPYSTAYDLPSIMNTINDHFVGDLSKEYQDSGNNQIINRVCSMLKFNQYECKKLQEEYSERDLNITSQFSCADATDESKSNFACHGEPEVEINDKNDAFDRKSYLEGDELEITDIPMIEQNINYKDSIRQTTSSLFSKRQNLDIHIKEDLFSLRPLYLTPLRSIDETVFSKVKDLKIKINTEKFEKYFCEDNEKTESKIAVDAPQKISIDPKRLFIASLCLKHLEIRKISLENLRHYLEDSPNVFSMQELSNILKCILTKEEKDLLGNIDRGLLSPIESIMLYISELPEIRPIVSILLFENIFFEEIPRIDKVISNINEIIVLLLSSNEIDMLFKIVLDISNMINYVYGRKRKSSTGFKIDSLPIVLSYSGIGNYPLLDFITETVILNGIKFERLKLISEGIAKIKKDDFNGLKDSINGIIFRYSESIKSLNEIEIYEKRKLKLFLGFACSKIKDTVSKFKLLEENIEMLKRKIGEDQKKPIESVFEPLYEFLMGLNRVYQKLIIQENRSR